jgi:hypothetical protein
MLAPIHSHYSESFCDQYRPPVQTSRVISDAWWSHLVGLKSFRLGAASLTGPLPDAYKSILYPGNWKLFLDIGRRPMTISD